MLFSVDNTAVDKISSCIVEFLKANGIEKRECSRFRILYEEILLKYRERFGEGYTCSLHTDKRLGQSRLVLRIEGKALNPFITENDKNGIISHMLAGLGILPTYSYKEGANCIILVIRKKLRRTAGTRMGMAVLSAILMGIAVGFFPEGVRSFVCTWLAEPISDLFIRLITAISGPLVFLSVVCGIYGIGDVATFGKIGKSVITRFLLMAALAAALVIAFGGLFFSYSLGTAEGADFSSLLDMVLDIVPNNLFTPFTVNNPLQIIFVAVIMGIAMVFLGNRSADTANIAIQLNDIVQLIMMYISKLVPIFVFISIFNLIVNDKLSELVGLYKPILLTALGILGFCILEALLTAMRRKVPLGTLIKKDLPVFMGGLTTASSAAVFGLNVDTCRNKLGIDKSLVDFGVPLGQVLFMPADAVLLTVYGLSLCEIYGVAIVPEKLIALFFIAIVLSAAAPPIPGGAITTYSVLIARMGVPAEAIALCVTMEVIADFATTGGNLFCLDMELTECAGRLNMLNTDVLRSK